MLVLGVVLVGHQLLPVFGVVGLHPSRHLQEAGVIVAGQHALLGDPVEVGDRPDFVHSGGHVVQVVDLELVDCVGHPNFVALVQLLA